MKIFVNFNTTGGEAQLNSNPNVEGYIGISVLAILEDGRTSFGVAKIYWSEIATSITLNNALKQAVIAQLAADPDIQYSVNILLDKFFFLGGFTGL